MSPVPDPTKKTNLQEQLENEAIYRQLLVQGALAVLLPTEELDNGCIRTLVADVIAETIVGNVIGGKMSESWFIWCGIVKMVDWVKAHLDPKARSAEIEAGTRGRLEQFGLLAEQGEHRVDPSIPSQSSLSSKVFWRILQYGYLAFIAIRSVLIGLVAASTHPPRSSSRPGVMKKPDTPPIAPTVDPPIPILSFRIFSLISVLLDLPLRMPWLSGCLSLIQHHLIYGTFQASATDGILDL